MALDNFKKTSMRIDKANQRFLDYQNAKVGDVNGRELLVQITNNGVVEDQTGTTLKLNWQHENGNQDSTNFKAVDIKTGKYSLYYPKEMLYKGTVDASVEINSNGQITHTMNFKIIVHGDVFNGEAGTVNGVFISLADVNKKLDDREKEYIELKERQTSVETQFDAVQQELTGKDVVSAPEIIAARGGESTLSARLDKEQQDTEVLKTKEININSYQHLVTDVLDADTMNWSEAINTAISEMNIGDTLEIPNNQIYGTTSSIVVDKSIKISGGATLVCYHNDTGIVFSPSSGNLSYMDIDIGVSKNEINWGDTSVGVHVKNSYHGIFRFPKVQKFTTGMILEGRPQSNGSAGAFTYNTVYIGRVEDHKTGIILKSRKGEGWCTENTFYGGSFGGGAGVGSEGIHLVFDSDEKGWNNNNKFFGTSFEGHYQNLLKGDSTTDNVFYACRYEMPKMIKSVDWGSDTQTNLMQNGYGLTKVIEKMTDNGRYNSIEYLSQLDGKVSYYDGFLFRYSDGTPNRLRGSDTHEVIVVGKKGSVSTSSNSDGLVTLDLSKGSEFFINATNGINKIDIINKPQYTSGLEISLHISQSSLGSDITKLIGQLGDNNLPVKRSYGLDLYTFKYFGEIGTYLFCVNHFAR